MKMPNEGFDEKQKHKRENLDRATWVDRVFLAVVLVVVIYLLWLILATPVNAQPIPTLPMREKTPTSHLAQTQAKAAQVVMEGAKASLVATLAHTNYLTFEFFTGLDWGGNQVRLQYAPTVTSPFVDQPYSWLMGASNVVVTVSSTNSMGFVRLSWGSKFTLPPVFGGCPIYIPVSDAPTNK